LFRHVISKYRARAAF